ncbi:MAG: hypothetical protein KDB07_04520 [Planctomycetes bacterium]|nr:hypothetical protein [Planctomycetota bacterium]
MILASIIPGWKYVSAGVGILVLGFIAWWILSSYVLLPSDMHEEQAIALDAVADDLKGQLIKHLDDTDRRFLMLAIAPIPEDTSNRQYKQTLEKRIDTGDRIKVDTKNLFEKIKSDGASLISSDGEKLSAEAIFADKPELNAVLALEKPRSTESATEFGLELKGTLYERIDDEYKETTFNSLQRVSFETQEVLQEGESGAGAGGWALVGMTFVAVLCALGIPFLWLPMTDTVTGTGNNVLGFAYLGVVLVSAMTPYFLFGLPLPFGILLGLVTAVWTYRMHDAWSERLKI